jgi:hypothetical protein
MTIAGTENEATRTAAERHAVRADAELRLAELQAVREVLLPDADDPECLSELTMIDSQIAAAEKALAAGAGR